MKVAVVTPWLERDKFVPIYNHIWTKQNYKNYDVHIFEEKNTLAKKNNKFNENFFVHSIDTETRIRIGAKRNYAFSTVAGKYDYILLADSDDYYSPNYISNYVEFMQQNDADIINIMQANYINLKAMSTARVTTKNSYSGTFFFKSKLTKYKWNEEVRAGEDRRMLSTWQKDGNKYIPVNVNENHWLGLIHGRNWNTFGKGWNWKKIEKKWLFNYLDGDNFLLEQYLSLI